MKLTICSFSATAALTFVFSIGINMVPNTSSAADPHVDAVLGINNPDCCHVIDLLMRNRIRKSMAEHGGLLPHSPHPYTYAGVQQGDLELLEVNLVCDGNGPTGPTYQISFRNTSCYAVRHFRISIVGVLCRIAPTSPCTMLTIPCINAGETKCVEIQLPASAMVMGPSGQTSCFDTLIVALDSFDELMECNELNNVAILKRAEIGLLVTETVTATEPAAIAPAEAAPSETTPPVPAPDEQETPSPLDNIDLDELELEDAEESALRVALETI